MVYRKPTALVALIFAGLCFGNLAKAESKAKAKAATTKATPAPAPTATKLPPPVATAPSSVAHSTLEFGIVSWPEVVSIAAGSGTYDGLAQFYAFSLGYSKRIYRVRDGYQWEGYLLWGKADLADDSTTVTYFQKRVPMYGFGADVGWFYRPEGRQVNIGLSAAAQSRHAQWEEPVGVTIENKELISLGLMLDMRWRMTEKLALNQRVGQFLKQKSAIWMMSLDWTL